MPLGRVAFVLVDEILAERPVDDGERHAPTGNA
jgi:hypothetical protein